MDYLERISQPSTVQMARLGDFRAIAYWLNACLVPQGIYARVAADRPGVLLVLLEFMRLPRRDCLTSIVCHRLCRLNSKVIRGVRILARFADDPEILWDTSIRLVMPAHRQKALRSSRRPRRQRHPATRSQAPRRPSHPNQRRAENLHRIQALVSNPPTAKPLPASPKVMALPPAQRPAPGRRRRRRVTPPPPALRLTPKFLQRIGSAAAAIFVLGLGLETWKQLDAGTVLSDWMNKRTSIRTASGRVPVIEGGRDSNNPIVTLTFAGGAPISEGTKPETEAAATESTRPAGTTTPRAVQRQENGTTSAQTQTSESTIPRSQRLLPRSDVMLANLNQPLPANSDSTSAGLRAADNSGIRLVNVSGKGVAGAGAAQLEETLKSLQQAGAHPVGAGLNRQEARRPDIVEVRGKRIAYLGYSDADDFAAGRWHPGTNPAFKERIAEDIAAIRTQVDWVIVNYHWSQDLASYPADWQIQMAHSAIDQGADLVVGYHPEVLQGAEIYKGRVIAYSLGNFIFADKPQSSQSSYDSAVLKVSLKDDRMRLEFIPVEVQDNQAAIATGQKAKDILTYIERSSALFSQPMKSPTILDRLALDPNKPAPPSEFNPPAQSEAQPSPAGDSFITYPEGTAAPSQVPQKTAPQRPLVPEEATEAPAPNGLEPSGENSDTPAPEVSEPEAMLPPESAPTSEDLPPEASAPEAVTDSVEEPIAAVSKPSPEPSSVIREDGDAKELDAETWASNDQPAADPAEAAL